MKQKMVCKGEVKVITETKMIPIDEIKDFIRLGALKEVN